MRIVLPQVILVNTYEFATAAFIFSVYAQEQLDGFLLTVRNAQYVFVLADLFVYIKRINLFEYISERVFIASELDKWQIKSVTVVMHKEFEIVLKNK